MRPFSQNPRRPLLLLLSIFLLHQFSFAQKDTLIDLAENQLEYDYGKSVKVTLFHCEKEGSYVLYLCNSDNSLCSKIDCSSWTVNSKMEEDDYNSRVQKILTDDNLFSSDHTANILLVPAALAKTKFKTDMHAAFQDGIKAMSDFEKKNDSLKKAAPAAKKDTVAKNSLQFLGSIYANFSGVSDDDPSGFTQYYARLSGPIRKSYGIDSLASYQKRLISFRNFMFQLTYAGTASALPVFPDTPVNSHSVRYVNRMDLLERAYLNANFTLNLLTYVIPSGPNHAGDLAHLYLQLSSSFLATKISDTFSTYQKSYSVYSSLYALSFGFRSENIPFSSVPIGIEMHLEGALLASESSSVNPDLNFQINNKAEYFDSLNSNKKMTAGVKPFLHFDALIFYNTNAGKGAVGTSNGSNIFLHFSYFSNLAKTSSLHFNNNYFQLQLGYALDIGKLFPSKSTGG